jgi:L-histidine N-alpha-methyltransferase
LNLFARMNRELDSGLDLDAIEHEAFYDRRHRHIEINALFRAPQRLRVKPIGKCYDVRASERIRTEISRKFRVEELTRDLARYGFRMRSLFTDPRGWFALMLLEKGAGHA